MADKLRHTKKAGQKSHDFTIVGSNGTVKGHVRVKANKILWAPKSSRWWWGLTRSQLDKLSQAHGKRQRM